MYHRQESEYYQAKMKAGRQLSRGWVKPKDLPSNGEIREQIQIMARMLEGEERLDRLREMRIAALGLMRTLARFRPKLIGSVLTGHVRKGSDIDLHLFSNSIDSVTAELDFQGLRYETEVKRVVKNGERHLFRHVHVFDHYEFELTVYPMEKMSHVFKCSITGKPIERASIPQFEEFLSLEYPELNLSNAMAEFSERVDPYQVIYSLLLPLENVQQNPRYHPEGDALYHSLQVFDLACDALPYDEEFLLAALLHDVGKGLDPMDHVNAGVEAIRDFASERTCWLVQNHMLAHKINDHSIGVRAHRRLRENESYEELLLLGECDRAGRCRGVQTTSLEDALDYVRSIGNEFG